MLMGKPMVMGTEKNSLWRTAMPLVVTMERTYFARTMVKVMATMVMEHSVVMEKEWTCLDCLSAGDGRGGGETLGALEMLGVTMMLKENGQLSLTAQKEKKRLVMMG